MSYSNLWFTVKYHYQIIAIKVGLPLKYEDERSIKPNNIQQKYVKWMSKFCFLNFSVEFNHYSNIYR